jgi:4-hydroxy-tetrahydrodipicolinate synthase
MKLSGVHTAVITPFQDGAVDLDTFSALCERQIDAGVQGIVVCGTTGETPTLDEDEWAGLVAAAVRVAAGRVPITAGCGTNSTAGTVANLSRAKALGADAALVVFPYYNKPSPAGHLAHIQACCRVGLPVVLYHVPGRTGQRLSLDLLVQLCEIEGVVGLKEATGDVVLGQALIQRLRIPVLSGDDFTMAELVAIGGKGAISVLSNVAPAMTTALVRAALTGDATEARALNERLQPVVQYLFSDTNPAPTKAAMAAMGLCDNALRLPLVPCEPPSMSLLEGLS